MFETKKLRIKLDVGTENTPDVVSFFVYELSIRDFERLMKLSAESLEMGTDLLQMIDDHKKRLEEPDNYTHEEIEKALVAMEKIQNMPLDPLTQQEETWRIITRLDDVEFMYKLSTRQQGLVFEEFRKLNTEIFEATKKTKTLQGWPERCRKAFKVLEN